MEKRLAAMLIALPLCAAAALPYTFSSGQTISAAEINANFAYLSSRIDALAPSGGAVTSKVGSMAASGQPHVVVLSNSGTAPIEILELMSVSSQGAFQITCGPGVPGPIGAIQPSLKYLAPGCTIYVREANAVLQPGASYVVTYRQ